MIKFISGILLACVLLFTSGCAQKAYVESRPMITQEVFLERCTGDTPLPTKLTVDKDGNTGYDGKEVLNVFIQWQREYDKCAALHDALVKAIRDMQALESVKIKIKE